MTKYEKKALRNLFSGVSGFVGYIFGVIGTLVTIFCINGQVTLDMRVIILCLTICFLVVGTAIRSIYRSLKITNEKNKFYLVDVKEEKNTHFLFVDYSELLEINDIVTIYFEGDYEPKEIGIGKVVTLPDNFCKIQIINFFDLEFNLKENRDKIFINEGLSVHSLEKIIKGGKL